MGVYLFLVFFFEAEDELDGDDPFFGAFDFHGGCYGYLGGVFVDVGCYGVVSDFVLRVCVFSWINRRVSEEWSPYRHLPGMHPW